MRLSGSGTPGGQGAGQVFPKPVRAVREWLLFALVMAIFGAWLGYLGYRSYWRTDTSQRERLLFQARTIEALIVQQLESIGSTLGEVRSDLPPNWPENAGLGETATLRFRTLVGAMPALHSIAVLDATTRIVASSQDELIGRTYPHPASIATALSNPDPQALAISPPFRSSLGVWTLILSRVIVDGQGRFAGLVSASLDPEALRVIMRSVLYTADTRAALIHDDGTLFVIEPDKAGSCGRNLDVPESFLTRHRQLGGDANSFKGHAYATDELRLVALRTVNPPRLKMERPLYVAVTRDLAAVFGDWRRDTLFHAGLYILFCCCGGLALLLWQKKRRTVSRAELHLSEAKATLESYFAIAPDLLCIAGVDGRFRKLNPAWETLLGYSLAEMEGTPFIDYVHPEDRDGTLQTIAELRVGKTVTGFVNRFRHQDGSYRYIEWQSAPRGELIFATARDVTERKKNEKRLEFLAYHDRLTGLANRSLLFGRLSQSLSSAARSSRQVAVLYLDLDGFKEINDRFGHDQGDFVLQAVAKRLLSAVRMSDTVSRVGGDEFVVILGDLVDPVEAGRIAAKLLAALDASITLAQGDTCRVGASIGISVFPANGREMNGLLEAADDAMYRSKQSGKNRYTFSTASPLTAPEEVGEIVLDETLLVGVREIDEQHRKMTEIVNRLNALIRQGAADDEVARVLDELLEFTTFHFSTERRLMERHGYPELSAHAASHEYLLLELADFDEKIAGMGKLFQLKLTRDWLLQHIIKDDLPLGEFLRQKQAEQQDKAGLDG